MKPSLTINISLSVFHVHFCLFVWVISVICVWVCGVFAFMSERWIKRRQKIMPTLLLYYPLSWNSLLLKLKQGCCPRTSGSLPFATNAILSTDIYKHLHGHACYFNMCDRDLNSCLHIFMTSTPFQTAIFPAKHINLQIWNILLMVSSSYLLYKPSKKWLNLKLFINFIPLAFVIKYKSQ